jgi:hypothetical protein
VESESTEPASRNHLLRELLQQIPDRAGCRAPNQGTAEPACQSEAPLAGTWRWPSRVAMGGPGGRSTLPRARSAQKCPADVFFAVPAPLIGGYIISRTYVLVKRFIEIEGVNDGVTQGGNPSKWRIILDYGWEVVKRGVE